MSFSYRLFFTLCAVVWLQAIMPPAEAQTGEAASHAQSAMLFAGRKDWNNAMLHARRSGDAVLFKLIIWEYFLDPDSPAAFDEITQFITANPHWPEQKKLRIRAELSLRNNSESDERVIKWFADDTPVTGIGKIALAQALLHIGKSSQEKPTYLVRDAWRNGDFDELQENYILANYGNWLKRSDDISRVDRLLWEDKIIPAQRRLPHVAEEYQKLFAARISLMEGRRNATAQVAQIPAGLRNDAGLLYEKMRQASHQGDVRVVRAILLAAPVHIPYPAKWWKYRETQIRQAIDEGNFSVAKKLLANHAQVDGQELADASWLKGWLELELSKQPTQAYDTFTTMFDEVRFPVSKARAAYWAGEAALVKGDRAHAASWFANAAMYPTTFYGQLGAFKSRGEQTLALSSPAPITAEDKKRFEHNELARAAKLCIDLNQHDVASHFIFQLVTDSQDKAVIAQAAALGSSLGYSQLSVRASKKAMQQEGIMAPLASGYPSPRTPAGLAVERPLALAIARQESEFDPYARSPSGALGLMQLLPGTAKETARKAGLGFTPQRLFEQPYNLIIGSHYLGQMVANYHGSYVMAIAAYNAGPGNVHKWAQLFGTPGNRLDNAVNWIERIPFAETRNYVQRVMENLQVYRYLETGGQGKLRLGEDLVR